MFLSEKVNKIVSKIKNHSYDLTDIPVMELSREREDEIINAFVVKMSSWGMTYPALLFGSPIIPSTIWVSSLLIVPFAPVLELFGIKGYEIAAFFNNRNAVERLMEKLEKIETEKYNTG